MATEEIIVNTRNVFDLMDKLFKYFFKVDGSIESMHYSRRINAEDIEAIHYDMNVIDSKSSALLTHISIMFVVLGFFLNNKDNKAIICAVFVIEFVGYIAIAMLLLRCVDIMGPPFRGLPDSDDEIKKMYCDEVALRRGIYVRALRLVYILTGVLVPIIIFKYFYLII